MTAVALAATAIAISPASAAPPRPPLPSSGCINDIPPAPPTAAPAPPPRPALPPPPSIDITIPYAKLVPVPVPGPPDDNRRIRPQQAPKNHCADPCPDLTNTPPPPPPAPAPSIFGLPLPKITITPQPFAVVPIPYPSTLFPQFAPLPPTLHPGIAPAPVTPPPPAPKVSALTDVARVTGQGSTSRTDKRWQVNGTDLGIMWETGPGQVAIAFGDSVGKGFRPPGGIGGDYRSNVLGFSTNRDLAKGIRIDTMVQDSRCHAAQAISSRKVQNWEVTTIPTSGFALGKRQFMSYMSVRHWGSPGTWQTNYGGLAYSDDGGSIWTKDPYLRWDNIFGTSNFQVSAMVPQGDYVYLFGTPNGRLGSTALARVPKTQVLNKTAYQYWSNGRWVPVPCTALCIPDSPLNTTYNATPVFGGPTGELSMRYDAGRRLWQATYLDPAINAIVLRESATPQGLWTRPVTLVPGNRYPGLYGGFMHPWSSAHELYFTMTQWQYYNVELMRVRLN
ncbi:DUF4185 domain-containing protein [Jongsikchunia kroppenstedtii]|uniref:DUF4185 domain-containing protein n=1 Tax=Jongsikchunia kroppenstedtii TaxID=1121721 RepID=UPI000370DCDD